MEKWRNRTELAERYGITTDGLRKWFQEKPQVKKWEQKPKKGKGVFPLSKVDNLFSYKKGVQRSIREFELKRDIESKKRMISFFYDNSPKGEYVRHLIMKKWDVFGFLEFDRKTSLEDTRDSFNSIVTNLNTTYPKSTFDIFVSYETNILGEHHVHFVLGTNRIKPIEITKDVISKATFDNINYPINFNYELRPYDKYLGGIGYIAKQVPADVSKTINWHVY